MDSNSNSSCQGGQQNIYDMDVQQLINTFTAGTIEMLGRNSSDPMGYLERVQYMPMKCLLDDNKPHNPNQVPRVKTIALWATLFASIYWINTKMSRDNPNIDYLRAALRRITYVCAVELNSASSLLYGDLPAISHTREFGKILSILMDPVFLQLFHSEELQVVQACFLKLGVNIITEGVGEMNLDSSSSASSSSSAAAPVDVRGSWLGRVVEQNKQIQQLQQLQQRAQASPSIPFAQSTSFTSNFGPPVNLPYATNTGQQPQAQAQGFGVSAPVTMTLEQALNLLGYRDIGEIGSLWDLNDKVKELKRNDPDKSMLYTDAGKIVRKILKEGGKRRTMKVKKHFIKTKKRIYKKGKKTRVRRNNKSKRVFKGKRRR
jgi:hypothetical protein